MGNKGSQTSNTSQTQTYTPNAVASGYITDALGRAASAANQPFAIPQAPVAGFSQDQMGAFQQFRDLQGMAQPYYNTASNYYSPQGISQFYNPAVESVTANLKDIFGAQNVQNNSNLVGAAGGIGADRIAVGQSELAKQQGLAAGQTYASLWNSAAQQAQAAGQGQMALGANAQNSALQGANALLGTGGLQQQLSQAQLNSPYQQQLAQAQFPYQQAQFYASLVGALAPGLGGTTSGYGTSTSTPAQPSIFSQLLGAGALGLGAYNAYSGSGSGKGSNNTMAGAGTAGNPYYGPVNPYQARGGRIGYARGGDVDPAIPMSAPIDISQQSIIPQTQITPMQAHIPQIDLSPPKQQSSGSSGPGIGDIVKLAMMFAADGGRVNPYAPGGRVSPYSAGDGFGEDPADPDFVYRMPDRPNGVNPYDTWRENTPLPDLTPTVGDGGPPTRALSLAADAPVAPAVAAIDRTAPVRPRARVADAADDEGGGVGTQGVSPYSPPSAEVFRPARSDRTGMNSPWAALMAAGAGMMAGTSPFAGVNIGQGATQGVKMLEAQRENERKDLSSQLAIWNANQQAQARADVAARDARRYTELTAAEKLAANRSKYAAGDMFVDKDGNLIPTSRDTATGRLHNAVTGEPLTDTAGGKFLNSKRSGNIADEEAKAVASYYVNTGDPSRINALGLTSEARQAVQRQIRLTQQELGISDHELANKVIEFKGRAAGARTLGVMEARMGSAAIEAEGAIGQARGVIERLDRTSFLPYNQLRQLYDQKRLNPDQAELYARTQAIVNTYSAVMARGANITTDSSRHHAAELLNTAGNAETYNRVLDTMLQEIEMAKKSPMKMREFYAKMYGDPGDASKEKKKEEPTSALPDAAKSKLKEGENTKFGNGQVWTLKGGVPVRVQ